MNRDTTLATVLHNIQTAIATSARLEAPEFVDAVAHAAILLTESLCSGGRLLICGNGGSAADAQHIAAELVGRYKVDRRALPALALTTDSSVLTAWSNDYDYSTIFSRQVEAHGRTGDVLMALSTSGNSGNVVAAAQTAKQLGLLVIGLTGERDSRLSELADVTIRAPSIDTPRIQEVHILAYHAICDCLDQVFSG